MLISNIEPRLPGTRSLVLVSVALKVRRKKIKPPCGDHVMTS